MSYPVLPSNETQPDFTPVKCIERSDFIDAYHHILYLEDELHKAIDPTQIESLHSDLLKYAQRNFRNEL